MIESLTLLAALNLFTFIVFFIDKSAARAGGRRASEAILFGLAIIGGSIGAIIGMYSLRHKTLKFSFRVGLPLILLVQALIAAFYEFDLRSAFPDISR